MARSKVVFMDKRPPTLDLKHQAQILKKKLLTPYSHRRPPLPVQSLGHVWLEQAIMHSCVCCYSCMKCCVRGACFHISKAQRLILGRVYGRNRLAVFPRNAVRGTEHRPREPVNISERVQQCRILQVDIRSSFTCGMQTFLLLI